jgi:hypothetical protein
MPWCGKSGCEWPTDHIAPPIITSGPMTVEEALLYAESAIGPGRRRVDQALVALADEVRRLQKQFDGIAQAADQLGEFVQERAD